MSYRGLPSVDRLLRSIATTDIELPHHELAELAREVLAEARQQIADGKSAPDHEMLVSRLQARATRSTEPRLRPVINASGVVIQTNLGRAPLSQAALAAIERVGQGYSNLEYDLEAGERGSRYELMGELLAHLTGAEAGLAVNNNAAAVMLVLACFCAGKQVLVSRSQAIEIGGGFRIPDVLRASGATLVEVGTTNRTYARDYAEAIGEQTAAILTVHRSNFRITGFTHDPEDAELKTVAREHDILWIDDWGSGSLLQPGDFGLHHEPTVSDRVRAGCDLVCFSGDKLLGGPQAGLIVGRADLIRRLRRFPLLRALRVDKMVIAAMEATLLSYLRGRALDEIPVWRMIATPLAALEARARALVATLEQQGYATSIVACESAIGGGTTPGETLPSIAIAFDTGAPDRLHAALRAGAPAVIGRIVDRRLLLDLRTVLPHEDVLLLGVIVAALERAEAAQPATSEGHGSQ